MNLNKVSLKIASLALGFTVLTVPFVSYASAETDTTDSPELIDSINSIGPNIVSTGTGFLLNPIDVDYEEVTLDYNPTYIPRDGEEYQPTSTKTFNRVKFDDEFENRGTTPDDVFMSITRSKFTEGTVGLTLEAEKNFGLVQGRIGFNGEVKWGKTGSDTQQYNWSIPAKSKIHVVYGARAVNTYGVIKTYSNGKVTKTVNVSPKYSVGRHYKKTETKL